MKTVKVVKAGLAELDILTQWRMQVISEVFSLGEEYDDKTLRENNKEYYRKHISDDTHTACLAFDVENGMIVGCGGICYQDELPSPDNPSGSCGYIMNVFTIPELRKNGVGRSIVRFLIDDAKSRGVDKIYLESSEKAKNMYYAIGFTDMVDYMKLKDF